MRKTLFAGLTVLEQDETVVSDGGAFIGKDRDTIDYYLELGARTHRHDGEAGLPNPNGAPSAAVIASAGTLPSDTTYTLGFTLEDDQGGETILSPTVTTSTAPPLDQPEQEITVAVDHDGGELLSDTYYYAIAWVDAEGGETPVGPTAVADVEPGFPNSEVLLSGLTTGMATASAGGWRLYRAVGGGDFGYMASGTADTFLDDGSVAANCDIGPIPDDINTTRNVNTLRVDLPLPGALGLADATFINVYLSEDGDFQGGTFLEQFPISSAGQSQIYREVDLGEMTPPDVSTSVGGATKIDPDTELLDWHWKRPVADSALLGSGALGDVKLVTDTGIIYGMLEVPSGTAWSALGGVGGGSGVAVTDQDGPLFPGETEIEFRASGAASVGVADSGSRAIVTIYAPSAAPGGGGGTGTHRTIAASAIEGDPGLQGAEGGDDTVIVEMLAMEPGMPRAVVDDYGGGSARLAIYPNFGVRGADAGVWPSYPSWGYYERLEFAGASGASVTIVEDTDQFGHIFPRVLIAASGVAGAPGASGAPGPPGASGAPGEQGPQGVAGPNTPQVRATGEATGPFAAPSAIVFRASGAMRAHAGDLGGGSAEVLFAPMGRQWASAMVNLASGASASIPLSPSAAGGRLLKISTNKRSRVRVYGDDPARTADLARPIGTLPEGDHGVLLDYANTLTASGGIRRLSPAVDAHNLDDPAGNVLYLNLTNYDATGDVIVAFLYVPTEVV